MTARTQIPKAAAGATIAILALVALAADQYAKFAALDALEVGRPVRILGDALQFTLVMNPGAAFSLGTGVTWVFTIALALVALVIITLMFTRVRSRLWALALGGLLGGVLGNLTDRLLRAPGFPEGEVVDFIHLPWLMPAIFNVADIFIVCSMIGIGLLVLIGVRLDGTRDSDHEQAAADAESTAVDADADAEAATDADEAAAAPSAAQPDIVIGEFDEADRYESRRERRERLAREAEAASAAGTATTAAAAKDGE